MKTIFRLKRHFSVFLVLCFCLSTVVAQDYQKLPQGIKTVVGTDHIEINFYNPATVRILKSPVGWDYTKDNLVVIEEPQSVKVSFTQQDDIVKLKSSAIQVALNLSTGVISYYDTKGNELLTEQGQPQFIDFNDAGTKTFRVKQSFLLEGNEPIYGLGILQNGKMSQRNQTKHLVQGNVEDVTPFIQSIKGYGLYWDNYSPTLFADNADGMSFESEVGDCVDYYFMYGGNADGVIAQMRALTGEVPMFPLWTYGYWQSKERYKSQYELLGVVDKYRELGVPLDGIIQDWQYWGTNYHWNAMEFLDGGFPDAKQMIDDVHAKNANIIITIWSSFGPMTKAYREMNEKGMLFNFKTWPLSGADAWPPNMEYPSGVRVYDAYNPEARDIYWKNLTRLYDLGMDGWWMDSTEPDHLDFQPEDLDTPTHLGSFRRVRNAYPLVTVGGVYDHQRATTSDKRVFILTRSGFAGQQRYGANVWSGDLGSSWESLRNQIPAGLNFTLTGNPNFNSDIGGFFASAYNKTFMDGSASRNPLYQELYVRWLQFGAFNPMMRSHGTDTPREIYNMSEPGDPVYSAIEKAINLRYSLLPYIYSTSWDVTNKQSSYMRALMMDFPQDQNVWDRNDEFMFGKSILVAPIVHAQYTPEAVVDVDENEGWNRDNSNGNKTVGEVDFTAQKATQVYLPQGTDWYDFWTNQKYPGGQTINRESTLDLIPLYIKAGSIVPIGPVVQYATEKPWDNLELKVYSGADGSFTLYEDEFDNYNYEKGAYTEIPMSWNDKTQQLTIGARKGAYEGMLADRQFTIVKQDGTRKVINYKGKKVVVRM